MNIWQSYQPERGCLMHCVRLATIGADSTGSTENFAPVLTQEPGQTLRFAPVPFMAVLWFFKWTLQLFLLNLTKGAKFAGSVGHPMTKMLSASGGLCRPPDQGLCPWTPLWALPPGSHYRLVLCTRHGAPPTTDPFRRLWLSNWTLPRYLKPKVGAYAGHHTAKRRRTYRRQPRYCLQHIHRF